MSTLYIALLLLQFCLVESGAFRRSGVTGVVNKIGRSTKLAEMGAAAVAKLLHGTTKVEPQDKGLKVFVKKGTAMTAYREFIDAVNRNDIIRHRRVFGVGFEGRVGDRIIYYTPFDHAKDKKPTIKIYNPNKGSTDDSGNVSDMIIYE